MEEKIDYQELLIELKQMLFKGDKFPTQFIEKLKIIIE